MNIRLTLPFIVAGFLMIGFISYFSNNPKNLEIYNSPAGPKTWVGGAAGDWNIAGNWNPSGIPGSGDDVIIGTGSLVTFTSGTSTINSINVNSPSGRLVLAGGSFTVSSASSLYDLEIKGASALFNGNTTVEKFLLWGSSTAEGVLGGSGTVTVNEEFNWYGPETDAGPSFRLSSRMVGPGKTVMADNNGSVSSYDHDPYAATLGGTTAGSGRILEVQGQLIQNGCLELNNNSLIDIKAGGELQHGGTCAIGWEAPIWGRILNAGTFGVYSTGLVRVPMTNTGLIDVQDYGLFSFYDLTNSGTIRGIPGSDIHLVDNNGNVPAIFPPSSVITVSNGMVTFSDGNWTIQGTYNAGTTYVKGDSSLTFASGASLQMGTLDIAIGNSSAKSSKVYLGQNLTLNRLNLRETGLLGGSGNLTASQYLVWVGGTMEGPGSTTSNGSTPIYTAATKVLGTTGKQRNFYMNGSGAWSDGNIDATSGSIFTIQSGHSMTAKGSLSGKLTNNGTLHVGTSPGTLYVNSYEQGATGSLKMEVGGSSPGESDRLDVLGTATLAGVLTVTEISPYSLIGNNLDIITFGNRIGSFSSLHLPPGGQISYESNAVNVSAGSAPSSVTISGATSGEIDQTYPFTATVSPGTIIPFPTYTWVPTPDSGQGTAQASYEWAATGSKTITVTVSNAVGSVFDAHQIQILDEAVSGLSAENSSPHLLGVSTQLTATILSGTNVSYAWDFGDGSLTGSGASNSHDYAAVGTYNAVVTATNTAGNAVTSTQVTLWGTVPSTGGEIYPAEAVTVTLASGVVSETIVLQFELQPDLTVPGMSDVGVFYELSPVYLDDGEPAELLAGHTYTIVVGYDEAAIPAGTDEASLALYYWEGGAWVKEPSSVVDTILNTITATPDHFSQWGIMTEGTFELFLPLVKK